MSSAKKILIVDDEDTLRTLVKAELEHAGFDVREAPGGEEALTYLARNEVDLVILDIKMPGMGGLDVLRRVREDDLARKVIMLTGVGELKIARESLDLGASDFMSKPFEMGNLLACINRVLNE
jgi:two-component system response regulator (stage 0 sporulation protein F)